MKPELTLRANNMQFSWKNPQKMEILSATEDEQLTIINVTEEKAGVYGFTATFQPVPELKVTWRVSANITLGKVSLPLSWR